MHVHAGSGYSSVMKQSTVMDFPNTGATQKSAISLSSSTSSRNVFFQAASQLDMFYIL